MKGYARRLASLGVAALGVFCVLAYVLPGTPQQTEVAADAEPGGSTHGGAVALVNDELASSADVAQFKHSLAQLQSLNAEARRLQKLLGQARDEHGRGTREEDAQHTPQHVVRDEGPEAPGHAGFPAAKSNPKCTNNLVRAGLSSQLNESDGFQCRQTDVVLVHIPKAGGTSIEKAGKNAKDPSGEQLWGLQYDLPRFRQRRKHLPKIKSSIPICRGSHGRKCCSWWHVPPRYMLDWRPYYSAPDRFCVVRNPYARALSEYSFRHGKEVRKLTCGQLNHTEVNAWLRARMQTQITETSNDQFTTLDDCHWYPQYQYIEPGVAADGARREYPRSTNPYIAAAPDGRSCNHVIKLEEFKHGVFAKLMAKLGLPGVVLPKSKGFNSGCKDLAVLDEDTRRMIRATYRQDFVQFGYTF